MRTMLFVVVASLLFPLTLFAQDQVPVQQQRQFVRAQMIREFADSLNQTTLAEIDRKVAAMTPQRLERLFELYQKRQANDQGVAAQQDAQLQQMQDPIRRQMLIEQYKARLAAARRGYPTGRTPGFAPVITTLPSGTSLGASAVVSPDRRYVRINATPFFSNVQPGNTYTFGYPRYQSPPVIPLRP